MPEKSGWPSVVRGVGFTGKLGSLCAPDSAFSPAPDCAAAGRRARDPARIAALASEARIMAAFIVFPSKRLSLLGSLAFCHGLRNQSIARLAALLTWESVCHPPASSCGHSNSLNHRGLGFLPPSLCSQPNPGSWTASLRRGTGGRAARPPSPNGLHSHSRLSHPR